MITHEDYEVEQLAERLFEQASAARKVTPMWRGRRTNRAYYRRRARAEIARRPLEQGGQS